MRAGCARSGHRVQFARGLWTALGVALVLSASACSTQVDGSPQVITSPSAAASARPSPSPSAAPSPSAGAPADLVAGLAELETTYAARIGVSAIDTATGRTVAYRADERFGYASTLKVFAAYLLLQSTPPAERDTVVTWTQSDVDAAGYSPVTSGHVADGLTLARLAEAAVRQSDNTALNVLLAHLGGPQALDAALEALGDDTSAVVDVEPALNTLQPGDAANTTTPAAFTADLRAILHPAAVPSAGSSAAAPPSALDASDRDTLLTWMSGNPTGDALIRAGAPTDWNVADKSGGAGPIRNDIAVVTPPGRAPLILTILTTKTDPAAPYDDALVSAVARLTLADFP